MWMIYSWISDSNTDSFTSYKPESKADSENEHAKILATPTTLSRTQIWYFH